MIKINSLTHRLGNKTVLHDVDLTVNDGSIMGIVGINGAGKSTLLRLLAGVYIPDGGTILYDGNPPSSPATRQNVFFLPDDPYYTQSSTPQNLFEFYKTFYGGDHEEFSRILSLYGINVKHNVRNFSKGMRRQVFIALALAIKPKYLLLDEAFDGLDPLARKIFKDSIAKLADQNGTSVIISSHSLRELEDFCDSFALIDNNTIKTHGDIASHVERLCKFELAFTTAPTPQDFDFLPPHSLNLRGKFVQIVLEGDAQACLEQLMTLSPAVIEQMPLDFEEAFLYDVNKNGGAK